MWSSGDHVVVRYLRDERAAWVRAVTVVEDTSERSVLFLAAGSPTKAPANLAAHSIWRFWTETWDFLGWYVNLQTPQARSPVGFDTVDQVLDIWVDPDQNWKWKDEDELEAAVRLGRFSNEEAAAIRAEGERVIAAWPFPTGWENWRPDPSWPIPQLPDGWDRV